jgi:hypothetical protein
MATVVAVLPRWRQHPNNRPHRPEATDPTEQNRHAPNDASCACASPKPRMVPRHGDHSLANLHERVPKQGWTTSGLKPPVRFYSPNANSMVWLRISRSSGVFTSAAFAFRLSPVRIATDGLPPTSKVMGGALKPAPTLISQSAGAAMTLAVCRLRPAHRSAVAGSETEGERVEQRHARMVPRRAAAVGSPSGMAATWLARRR